MIATMPNLAPDVPLFQCHRLMLPAMCPVSTNPKPGSAISIFYRPARVFLEVYDLERFVYSFVGGHWTSDGAFVRDMEQSIQTIARVAASSLGVAVRVRADLVLDAGAMHLVARGSP